MNWRVWSGSFGIAFVVLNGVIVGMYAAGGAAPRPDEADALAAYVSRNRALLLTNVLLAMIAIGCFYVWLLGLRSVLRGAQQEAAAALTFGVGLVNGVFTLAGACLVAAAAFEAGAAQPEPIVVRALFQASFGLFAPSNLMTALFIAPAAWATLASGALPRWTGVVGYAAALGNLAAVPTLYGGTDPSRFYSVAGAAGVVLSLLPFLIYTLATSIALVRSR
jgi:hypothetical protein